MFYLVLVYGINFLWEIIPINNFLTWILSFFISTYEWIIPPFKYDGNGTLIHYRGWGGDIVIPKDVTVADYAFKGCTGITQLTIPEGVTIGFGAFWECKGITQLTISEGVTIGEWA